MQANPVGNLGRSTAAPELPGASHGDGPWYRYCKGYCGSRAWERKKETVPDEHSSAVSRGFSAFLPARSFKNHLTVTLSPKPPELARSRSTALPRHSRFFDASCPHCTKLCTAHYFILRNLRLSKNLPPPGRRVAARSLRQKIKSTLR